MSSLSRFYPEVKQGLTRFLKPESPCYEDTGFGQIVLFPFSYSNGVLDISYSGNTFEADMVTATNIAPSSETDVSIRIIGGPFLVSSLGSKFKDYIRAWRDGTIDAGSPIEIDVQPQIYRVQQADSVNIDANSGRSYQVSTKKPSSDYYVTGSIQNVYQTTYIFKTPLTFTIVESGETKYITFRTQLDQE
jgi:hypothetical protein